MAIKNVNGRNVYVLDTGPVTGKTTSGKNWANLYSDLRWQVYEQVQKDQAAQMQLEGMSYKADLDIYEQASRDIRRSIVGLQKLKAEALSGGTTARQIASRASEQAEMDYKVQRDNVKEKNKSKGSVTTKVTSGGVDMFGDPIPADAEKKTKTTKEGYTPSLMGRIVIGDTAQAEGEQPDKAGALGYLDREIANLEAELSGLERPEFNINGSIMNRTRRAYERDIGVMGKGGGAFGLAPRPNRMLPRVDELLAQERVDKFAKDMGAAQDQAVADWSIARGRKLKLISELEALGQGGEGGEVDVLRSELSQMPQSELEVRDAVKSAAVNRLREVAPPVAEGDFLRRPPSASGALSVGRGRENPPDDQPDPDPFEDDPQVYAGDAAGVSDFTIASEAPIAPSIEAQKPVGEIGNYPDLNDRSLELEALGVPGPSSKISPESPVAPGKKPIIITEEQLAENPDAIDDPSISVSPDLIQEALNYYKGMTIQKGSQYGPPSKPRKIRNPVKYFGSENEMIKSYILDKKREKTDVGSELDRSSTKVQPNTKQRKEKYKLMVVKAGIELSSKPKKLDRLAKASLEDDKRPKHIAVVDKIYEANKDNKNAFAASFEEISRAFADDPKTRKEAHVYLVAKDALENQKKEPLV
jgi:hypothetical protein